MTPQQEAQGNQAVLDMLGYLKGLVAERRRHPGNPEHDVLTRLIQGEGLDAPGAPGGDTLSEVELLQNCIFILNAGHETTTNLIGNALVTLQEWPDKKQELLSNMQLLTLDARGLEAYLALNIDEFLRFESSNQLGNRRALRA